MVAAPVTSIIENNAKIPTHAPTQTPSSSWFRPVSAIEAVMVPATRSRAGSSGSALLRPQRAHCRCADTTAVRLCARGWACGRVSLCAWSSLPACACVGGGKKVTTARVSGIQASRNCVVS